MKNLKIRLGLFSLLAILVASVFLTSCEQEDILPDIATDSIEQIDLEATPQAENTLNLWLPESVVGHGEEATQTYISSMTPDELTEAAKDFATIQYVRDLNKMDLFQDYIIENGSLRGANLSNHLSTDELSELNTQLDTYTFEEVSERCSHYVCRWQVRIIGTTVIFYKYCYWV